MSRNEKLRRKQEEVRLFFHSLRELGVVRGRSLNLEARLLGYIVLRKSNICLWRDFVIMLLKIIVKETIL